MNKERRKLINDALSMLSQMEEAKADLETARDEEQDYFDNMPESLQGGEKGSDAEAAVSALETLIDALGEAIDAISEVESIA